MAELLWEGISQLDNTSYVRCFLTGRNKSGSKNSKTGNVLQTYILLRDIPPVEGAKTGADFGVCGDCKHRSPRTCYVNLGQAPYQIFNTAHTVPTETPTEIGRGRSIRLGAYGDPAAVPYEFWYEFLKDADDWLGYTHQWRTCDPRFKRYCMASVDSKQELDEAHDLGWRCFYVGQTMADRPARTALCPASKEAGKILQCADCMACSGLSGKHRIGDIFIPAHGPTYIMKRFKERKAA